VHPDYARAYRRLYEGHWWWRARENYLCGILKKWTPQGQRQVILDVGCGAGLFFNRLAEYGEVFGVENDETLRTGDLALDGRIHWGPLEDLQRTREYSVVLMLDVLEHLGDPKQTLASAARLLQPGGLLVATVPAFMSAWTEHDVMNRHVVRYNKNSFKEVLKGVGLKQLELSYFFHWTWFAKVALRYWERLYPPGRDVKVPVIPPSPINKVLFTFCLIEQRLSLHKIAPVGSSLLYVGQQQ
jgi:SAM-dependent methyltransferase